MTALGTHAEAVIDTSLRIGDKTTGLKETRNIRVHGISQLHEGKDNEVVTNEVRTFNRYRGNREISKNTVNVINQNSDSTLEEPK